MSDVAAPVLRVIDVKKSFGGTPALAGVSFELARGSIHALLGGNGSGKSTLVKILAGVVRADAGELEIREQRLPAPTMTPARARDEKLVFVHQQGSTFADLTVAENLAIGRGFDPGRGGRISWRDLRKRSEEVLERFHIDADPRAELGELSPASRAMVAIARALQDQDQVSESVLVLDEPTASLPSAEVDLLLSNLRRCAAGGQAILYVTHRLEEVLDVADRATVFRDGRVVATVDRSDMSRDRLVETILGAKAARVLEQLETKPSRVGQVIVRATSLSGGPVREASFDVREGEVVGIAGLLGSGRSSLLRMLAGAAPIRAGQLELDGRPVRFETPRQAIAAGVAYVPEDRLAESAFVDLTVMENLGIANAGHYFRGGSLRTRAERRDSEALMKDYLVKAPSMDSPLTSLSGGNQQKVVLARWMRRRPRLLLLDEPTQGVDVGARAEIWQLVRRAVDAGAVAFVVASDMEELCRVCDRALVLSRGRIVAELAGPDLDEDRLDRILLRGSEVSV